MNKTPRLSKSGVEYLDYSWGIWSGCRNLQAGICSVKACWAKGIALHYPNLYPDGFDPHYYHEAIESPMHLKKPSRISVGWVGDIIGYCDSHSLAREAIIQTIEECLRHTFLFLTKNPEKLFQWSPFPDNCWVGGTINNQDDADKRIPELLGVEAKLRFISIEPCQGAIDLSAYGWLSGCNACCNGDRCDNPRHYFRPQCPVCKGTAKGRNIDWVIIGAQTKPYKPPERDWVIEIIEACDKAGIPVFLKNNLVPMLNEYNKKTFPHAPCLWDMKGKIRQEFPGVKCL